MNFTYELTRPEDGEWGKLMDDGISWTGMVGNLQKKEIDIGTNFKFAPISLICQNLFHPLSR